MEPVILKRPEHNVSRKNITSAAIKVLYRLKDEGYTAYIAGGGVCDLLLDLHPKDFDVATNATATDAPLLKGGYPTPHNSTRLTKPAKKYVFVCVYYHF